MGLPLHSSKRSKHSFTQHQLVVLRTMLPKSYREFADWFELMTPMHRRLGIRTTPHFTTLHKISLRLEPHMLDGPLAMLATPGPGPDQDKFVPARSKAVEHGASIASVIGDKGYDSEANGRYVVRELVAETHIPLRKVDRKTAAPERRTFSTGRCGEHSTFKYVPFGSEDNWHNVFKSNVPDNA